MITNDLYEGSGSMRRDGPSEFSEARDRVRMPLPGGASMDVHRTAAHASPPCGKAASELCEWLFHHVRTFPGEGSTNHSLPTLFGFVVLFVSFKWRSARAH